MTKLENMRVRIEGAEFLRQRRELAKARAAADVVNANLEMWEKAVLNQGAKLHGLRSFHDCVEIIVDGVLISISKDFITLDREMAYVGR